MKITTITERKMVVIIVAFFVLLSLFSAIYFIIPFEKPIVVILSNEVVKLLKLPTKAIPIGPTNTANNFEVISPVIIFIKTLILFKEVILNKLD